MAEPGREGGRFIGEAVGLVMNGFVLSCAERSIAQKVSEMRGCLVDHSDSQISFATNIATSEIAVHRHVSVSIPSAFECKPGR